VGLSSSSSFLALSLDLPRYLSLSLVPLPNFLTVICAWLELTSRADEAHQGRVTLDYNQFVCPATLASPVRS
jgi:hypothetical protein